MGNELTAKELLDFFDNVSAPKIAEIFEGDDNFYDVIENWSYAGIIDKIKGYKKHTEIDVKLVETCRIIQIRPNGVKECVYEEDIYNSKKGGIVTDKTANTIHILKEYASTHEGDFFAVKVLGMLQLEAMNNAKRS